MYSTTLKFADRAFSRLIIRPIQLPYSAEIRDIVMIFLPVLR